MISTAMVVGIVVLVIGVILVMTAIVQRMSSEPRYCSGALTSWWWRLVFVPGWFGRWGYCRYDLSRMHRDPASDVGRCPECGLVVGSRRKLWYSSALVRIGRLGTCLVFAAPIIWFCLSERETKRSLVRGMPTWVLVYAEDVLGPVLPAFPRDELRRRLRSSPLTAWERRAAARVLSRDLGDDDQEGNAARALRWYSTQDAELALETLVPLLDDADWQTRHLAADLLRDLDVEPFPRLLELTLEGLRGNDAQENLRVNRSYQNYYSIQLGFSYFMRHPAVSRPYVERGLHSSDLAQRFYCAIAASFARYDDLADIVLPILIVHLRDNLIDRDAAWAGGAILKWGQLAIPYLEAAAQNRDPQLERLAVYLLWHLLPPAERAIGKPPLPRNSELHDIDGFDPLRHRLPRFGRY